MIFDSVYLLVCEMTELIVDMGTISVEERTLWILVVKMASSCVHVGMLFELRRNRVDL